MDNLMRALDEAARYFREEADFNRSWVDGRRGADQSLTDAYKARRIELAEERDRWAAAIEEAITKLPHQCNPA